MFPIPGHLVNHQPPKPNCPAEQQIWLGDIILPGWARVMSLSLGTRCQSFLFITIIYIPKDTALIEKRLF